MKKEIATNYICQSLLIVKVQLFLPKVCLCPLIKTPFAPPLPKKADCYNKYKYKNTDKFNLYDFHWKRKSLYL